MKFLTLMAIICLSVMIFMGTFILISEFLVRVEQVQKPAGELEQVCFGVRSEAQEIYLIPIEEC